MDDESRLMFLRIDFPQLFQPDTVYLRVAGFAQAEPVHELPAEMSAAAFTEKSVFAVQLDARLELAGRLAVATDPHVAGRNAAHAAVFMEKHLGRGEPRVDFHSERLGRFA